jgi:hypothetical protein
MASELGKAVFALGLIAGGIYAYTHFSGERHAEPARPADYRISPVAEVGPAVSSDEKEQDLSGRAVIAQVYECTGSAGRILSDKPCAEDARILQVREPNRMVATDVPLPPKRTSGDMTASPPPQNAVSVAVVIPGIKNCKELNESEPKIELRVREATTEEWREYYRQELRNFAKRRVEWNCGKRR